MSDPSGRRRWLGGLAVVFLVGAAGMLLALQGWRSRIVNVDLLPHVESAQAFLGHGTLPDRGCLSGFASYIPPGVTWFFLPGVWAFDDPRLFEVLGSGVLFVGTLLGIFVLARDAWGLRCALLAVGLYGLSELGLHYAGWLWPRGHPFFYVWMIYWAERWVHRRQAWYLAAALVTWAAGMYVFLELGPALLVLAALWLWHRPPLRLAPLVVAATVSLIIWYPYLTFEAGRGFVDLRSQLLQQHILPADYLRSWCDPTLTSLREWGETDDPPPSPAPPPPLGRRVLERGKALLWGLTYNFERVARLPGAGLLLLAVSSLTLLQLAPAFATGPPGGWPPWLRPVAIALIVGALLADEFFLYDILAVDGKLLPSTGEALRLWHVGLGLTGFALLLGSSRRRPRGESEPRRTSRENALSASRARILAVSLLIPWVILLLLAETNPWPLGGERRFWWLWPLQVIMLAAAVTHVLPRWSAPRPVVFAVGAGVVLVVLLNPLTESRVGAWVRAGWSGPDAPEIQTVDFIAEQLRRAGRTHAAIGYQTLYTELPAFNFFMADFHVVDARYKVGAVFDLLFASRHGITNTNRCAEGVSADDEYRVVEDSPVWAEPRFARLGTDSRFERLRQFGPYQVLRRR